MAKKKKRVANTRGPVKRPLNWEKAVLSAHVIVMGGTVEQAASLANCSPSTIANWRMSDWWQEALDEGVKRWRSEAVALIRENVVRGLKDPEEYASMTKWAGDRLVKELAPPKNRVEVKQTHENWLDELE